MSRLFFFSSVSLFWMVVSLIRERCRQRCLARHISICYFHVYRIPLIPALIMLFINLVPNSCLNPYTTIPSMNHYHTIYNHHKPQTTTTTTTKQHFFAHNNSSSFNFQFSTLLFSVSLFFFYNSIQLTPNAIALPKN